MTFVVLKTLDNRDFICNTSNIITIEPEDYSVALRLQKGVATLSAWANRGLQDTFRIAAEKGTAPKIALGLAEELNAAEKSGTLLDLRARCSVPRL